jgi:hypothetical protein
MKGGGGEAEILKVLWQREALHSFSAALSSFLTPFNSFALAVNSSFSSLADLAEFYYIDSIAHQKTAYFSWSDVL